MPEMCPKCYRVLDPPADGGGIWNCSGCNSRFTMHLERKREFGRIISQTKEFTKLEDH